MRLKVAAVKVRFARNPPRISPRRKARTMAIPQHLTGR
jgi:hypothetical protein